MYVHTIKFGETLILWVHFHSQRPDVCVYISCCEITKRESIISAVAKEILSAVFKEVKNVSSIIGVPRFD
jgi:hypothetical protein